MAAAIDNYIEWMDSIQVPWLTGNPVGKAYNVVFGTMLNQQVDLFRQAVKARMPGLAPEDALPYIGEERNLMRGPDETTDHFRERLQKIWNIAPFYGTAVGMLLQLAYQGYGSGMYIMTNVGQIFSINTPLNESSPDFPADELNLNDAEANYLIPSHPPYFALPIRSYLAPIPSSFWDYTLPNNFGVQQTNRFILLFDIVPDIWVDGIPSQSQLNIIDSIVGNNTTSWKAARSIFEGIIVRRSGDLCNISSDHFVLSVCGSSLCGGSADIYLSSVY